jgi:glycine/D-amino acid oxidase-like deaminating enzyme
MSAQRFDAAVVGGGFFGCYFADHLARRGRSVIVLEREPQLMTRASLINQARIHRGYHYPRSLLTGIRSAANYERFSRDFANCVDASRPAYYAVARSSSNVTAQQYRRFCETIGIPVRPAPPAVRRLFSSETIEEVFAVEEIVFDAVKLRQEVVRRLTESGVTVRLGSDVARLSDGGVFVGDEQIDAGEVFVCTYAGTNDLFTRSGMAALPLRHELVEMALIEPPPELAGIGVTVMCGPFFSTIPFPSRGLHTLSHVRYTPHYAWSDPQMDVAAMFRDFRRRTQYPQMIRDAQRYLPAIAAARYVESLWEVKTILPQSDANDSRPILYHRDAASPHVAVILGAKIDNIYDVCDVYDAEHARGRAV